jgi:PhnB protein
MQADSERRKLMNEGTAKSSENSASLPSFVRPGFNNIAPYIVVNGAAKFIEFLKAAFQGTERLRVPRPDGAVMHAEIGIGNSVIELADANEQHPPRPTTVHLYVDDADAAYERALQAGATSIYPVDDQFWGDRQGCAKDEFGNVWYIALAKTWEPSADRMRSVQPYLHLRGAEKMIPFAEAAFRAETLGVTKSPEGKILHATVKINHATFEIDEAEGQFQPMPSYLHVYVPDADAGYAAAVRAGATSVETPATKSYGERCAAVKDEFDNTWFMATYLGGAEV